MLFLNYWYRWQELNLRLNIPNALYYHYTTPICKIQAFRLTCLPSFRDIIYSSLVHYPSIVLGCICFFILVAFLVYCDATPHFIFSLPCEQLRVATPK